MNAEIESLNDEINAIQTEISNLRREEQKVTQPTSIKAGSPSEIAKSVKAQVVADAQLQPKINGIQQAIAMLQRQLSAKQSRLTELKQESYKQELEASCQDFEERLINVAQHINDTSNALDDLLKEFKTIGLEYNKLRSQIEKSVVYGVELKVNSLPGAFRQDRMGKFYLKVGSREVGKSIDLDYKPEPLPKSSLQVYLEETESDTFEWKQGSQQAFITALQHQEMQTPAWDTNRLELIDNQIKHIQKEIEATKEPVK